MTPREPRFCYIVLSTQRDTDRRGYVPSAVFEGEAGHSPMTGDPAKLQTPWVWGPTLEDAERQCKEVNRRMGLTDNDVAVIVASSMAGSGRRATA